MREHINKNAAKRVSKDWTDGNQAKDRGKAHHAVRGDKSGQHLIDDLNELIDKLEVDRQRFR